jgi:hypothetical protein
MEITNGHGMDAVIDAVSRQSATDLLDTLAILDTSFLYQVHLILQK